ncbi:hypothetical protein [Pseudomonas sp. Marseille-Q5115]|uniref:hypothetical protein n=1 Tax=Pseudomonas sp. Marseille-Q5115 TaxID=2866593 RepID=UPI001CE3E6D8|nr:hypothetical protein [Pseudomonas sp. Marseille-Q5115]
MHNAGNSLIAQRLHDKTFVTTANHSGLSDARTLFHYLVDGDVITGTYTGGHIVKGQLVGRVAGDNRIELLYHCVTDDGQLLAGWSEGTVDVREDGKTELAFTWGWLAGASGGGESRYVEAEG